MSDKLRMLVVALAGAALVVALAGAFGLKITVRDGNVKVSESCARHNVAIANLEATISGLEEELRLRPYRRTPGKREVEGYIRSDNGKEGGVRLRLPLPWSNPDDKDQ